MTHLNKLRTLLAELFQFDQADLDFGIYRIMNQKRDEISRFLDQDLLPQVRATLEEYQGTVSSAGQAELDEAIRKAKALGIDPDSSPRVKELKERLGPVQDTAALEEEVFSHLYDFFRRYYSEGDFISMRRYKEGVYAIPYEGEEVKLYWANHDQYYVKSSENFRNYTFRLPDGRMVHFRIVEAATGRDNNRAQDDKNRRFMLFDAGAWEHESTGAGETEDDTAGPLTLGLDDAEEDATTSSLDPTLPTSPPPAVAVEDGALVVRFVYLPDPNKRKQDTINAETAAAVLAAGGIGDWLSGLKTLQPTEKNPTRTLLDKHLDQYTKRNTFDYFIHKDLGGFLRRELDFYIKNEIIHLDDIENESAPRVEQYLGKVRALRKVAGKLITFLAQLEDFQKRLWLKKKFVVETNYCVTLDRVPEELWPEVFANRAQREEWARLFDVSADGERPEPFTPFLVVDTAHFPQEFRDRLLREWDGLDEQTDGLLVHSENSQALSLLMPTCRGRVACTYIDPPYNTGNDEFLYKDSYPHSSWLSLMAYRLFLAKAWMAEHGALFVSIDRNERDRLRLVGDLVFGAESYLNTFVWLNNLKGRQISGRGAAGTHEYVLAYGKEQTGAFDAPVERFKELMPAAYKGFNYDAREDSTGSYVLKNELHNTNSKFNEETRPKLVFNIHYNPNTGDIRFSEVDDEAEFEGFVKIAPKTNNDGAHKYHAWRWSRQKIANESSNLEFIDSGGRMRVYTKVRGHQTTTLKDMITDISTSSGTQELAQLLGRGAFPNYPKPVHLVEVFARQTTGGETVLDFFAGSGTTAHAVINLNREDDSGRKYILVEMGAYFDTVLLPRIKKVVYSKDWKDGKPVSREGSSHLLKYIRLESYEDALDNLELTRTPEQQLALDAADPQVREEYLLSYMLDLEATGSQSLLNLEAFAHPFEYKLKVATGIAGETKTVNVDLVETFNYLIGLRVKHIDRIRGVRVVEGTTGGAGERGDGGNGRTERVLVLWRDVDEVDNDALDDWFRRQGYNTRDLEYDVIYVNGDNNLENLRRADQTWKVRLIEADFHRLMFDVSDV